MSTQTKNIVIWRCLPITLLVLLSAPFIVVGNRDRIDIPYDQLSERIAKTIPEVRIIQPEGRKDFHITTHGEDTLADLERLPHTQNAMKQWNGRMSVMIIFSNSEPEDTNRWEPCNFYWHSPYLLFGDPELVNRVAKILD